MAEEFSQDDKEDLIERGFNNEQIEYLESLEMGTERLYSDICKIMDDYGDTPEQIIESYESANNNNPQEEAPQQGGKRTRKNRKSKKSKRTRKSKKSRKSYKKSKKGKRTRKSRKNYKTK
jgi:hypothetical protein